MELKGYYYYSINDPKKEAIDRVAAMSRLDALESKIVNQTAYLSQLHQHIAKLKLNK